MVQLSCVSESSQQLAGAIDRPNLEIGGTPLPLLQRRRGEDYHHLVANWNRARRMAGNRFNDGGEGYVGKFSKAKRL